MLARTKITTFVALLLFCALYINLRYVPKITGGTATDTAQPDNTQAIRNDINKAPLKEIPKSSKIFGNKHSKNPEKSGNNNDAPQPAKNAKNTDAPSPLTEVMDPIPEVPKEPQLKQEEDVMKKIVSARIESCSG